MPIKSRRLFRTKPIEHENIHAETELKRCLTAFDLTILGIGAVIGAGIFVLTGIAAATQAGPAIVYSYILAGFACAMSALAYAELAASVGGCGSAYGYTYASFGELIAWIIGWDLLLEYGVSCSAVAIGWAGYLDDILNSIGIYLPATLLAGPWQGGIVNLPAMLIVLVLTVLLAVGVHESARFNAVIVFIKLVAIAVFVGVASFHINPANWHPFMPFGWHGVVSGAALVFFAYIGFDAVSTAAEETIKPQRNLPIGIIASLLICTLIYVLVSGLLTGVAPYASLNNSSPIAGILIDLGQRFAAGTVAFGALAGLTTVILVMFYGLTRVMLAMSRDGLLPRVFAGVNGRTQTPIKIILLSGVIIALISGLTPMRNVAELANIGTLMAFTLVCGGVVILRYTQPDLPRPFRTPFSPWIPLLGVGFCVYLMVHLAAITWWAFLVWMIVGLVVYFGFSYWHSVLNLQVKKPISH